MPGDGKQVVRSLLFWERESSLIDQTIHLFDWNKGEKRKMPPSVKLAHTLIAFPSLRELDYVAVGDRVDLTAPWDDDATREDFEVKFERLQEKLPTLYTPEFIELVRAAVETDKFPVYDPNRANATPAFARAVNALYHWQDLQGWDRDIGVPCRGLARVLGHQEPDHANLMLGKMVKLGFLRLVTKGGRGGSGQKPSMYRFIGRIVDGTIEPDGIV